MSSFGTAVFSSSFPLRNNPGGAQPSPGTLLRVARAHRPFFRSNDSAMWLVISSISARRRRRHHAGREVRGGRRCRGRHLHGPRVTHQNVAFQQPHCLQRGENNLFCSHVMRGGGGGVYGQAKVVLLKETSNCLYTMQPTTSVLMASLGKPGGQEV